jgi:SAM-dependent methyltransferase
MGDEMPVDGGVRQQAHYEAIHDEYEAHYYDASSLAYRNRFILDPLLRGVDLNGKRVLDVASGSGFNTLLLQRRYPSLHATGVDISPSACAAYSRVTGFPALHVDLTKPCTWGEPFDAAMVIGGLHHCVSDLPQTLRNLANAVRPGGILLMMEPNADCWLEGARQLWYSKDRYFDAPTEHALSHERLVETAAGLFEPETLHHIGGPAYFLILNSLVLRVPLSAKPWLSKLTFPLESTFNGLNSRTAAPVFLARWRRLPDAR